MNIYYQWNPWSYMNIASKEIVKNLNIEIKELIWMPNFSDVWKNISLNDIWILAIENSYMGSIHPNLYGFLKHDFKIIWEYYLEVKHCLCSKETDIKNIKKAYSQIPALEQCHKYLKNKNIKASSFWDTALAAKYISSNDEKWSSAICSIEAAKLYWLNILDTNIADQKENTTRFVIIVPKESEIKYNKISNKISIIFEAKNISSSLHKCLWTFATNNINLTKIESLPSYKWAFTYYFWLDFEWNIEDENIKKALTELDFFTNKINILGNY
jgi:prephenate dehydratase